MITRDDLPDTPDWQPEPRCCPFESCDVCGTEQTTSGFGTYPSIPPNVILGSE